MNSTTLMSRFVAVVLFMLLALPQPGLRGAEPAAPKTAESARPPAIGNKEASPADDTAATLRSLQHQVDALQVELANGNRPWYLDAATIISVLALIFSFGTTWVSNRKADAQDIENHRNELRSLLQRMAELPKENLEAMEKYRTNPAALSTVGGYINQENTFLSGQAAEIARHLPPDRVSAVEYYAIALGLANAYNLEGQKQFLTLAIENARDFNTAIAAIRSHAVVMFQTGKPDAGRSEFRKALAIFDDYHGYDEYTKASTHIKTETAWAFTECNAQAGSPLAEPHLAQADRLAAALPPSPGRDQLEAEIRQARQQLRIFDPTPKAAEQQPHAAGKF